MKTIAIVDADSCIYQAAWQQESIDSALSNYKHLISKNWIDPCWADESIVYCGNTERDNFRYKLCPNYKANRKSIPEDAKLFKPLMEAIANEELAIPSAGMEADDMVRIKAEELRGVQDVVTTIVHIDKDLDCIAGMHYNPRHERFYDMSENDADLNYWLQMLKGDPTDNLPGLPRVGEKTAKKILNGVPMERRRAKVLSAYRAKFGSSKWKDKLLETANGIHILKHKDDFFEIGSVR